MVISSKFAYSLLTVCHSSFNSPLCFHRVRLTRHTTHRPSLHSDSQDMSLNINKNSSFCQKHPRFPDGSDASDRTSHPQTDTYTLPFTPATTQVRRIPPVLCTWSAVRYTHHQNDTYVTVFPDAEAMQQPLTQHLGMNLACSSWVPHITSPQLLYIRCRTCPTDV
jgi:hypothetical protein